MITIMEKNKKTTLYWEKIKDREKECLCYSESKGLYKQTLARIEDPNDLIYCPQGYYGKESDTIDIPEKNIRITITSNFGYRTTSYLKASFEHNGYRILDFDKDILYAFRKCSIKTICVPQYRWEALFDKIISAYNEALSGHYDTSSIAYIEEIEDMLDKKEICIREDLDKEKNIKWNGDFSVLLFAGNKIRDMLEAFELAKPIDSTISKHLIDLCRKYIKKLKSLEYVIDDSRLTQLSEALLAVHKFMNQNGAADEYFRYFTSTQ